MRNFTFYSPTFFAFGKDAEKDVGKYVRRFGGTKVLIHYGGGSAVRSGLLDRVKASLEEEGLPYVALGGAKKRIFRNLCTLCAAETAAKALSGVCHSK